jgi:hypothetical protein
MVPVVTLGLGALAAVATPAQAVAGTSPSGCNLNNGIKHVIEIQFDNTHFTRDNPNVPSDLEQMPHLLNFIENNGTLLSNHHTPLISHTADDILTTLTGVYGDHHGVPVANSFRYFNPDGTSNLGVSFAYWTDPIYDPTTSTPSDTTYNMLTAEGKNAPAPWVPFTRAGCNVGGVATANIELENIGTDIPTVFGATSPEASEVNSDPAQATADFVGIAIHCSAGSPVCGSANARPDILPQEPGGYTGFEGLFGHKYVAPAIGGTGPDGTGNGVYLKDLDGNLITDGNGHVGFPGFGGISAAQSLGYVAAMQEHGVPITYAYISDAHDNHAPGGAAYGPGEAGYVAQLKSYDDAFGKFFARLAADGINKSNTLFVFTADEGDHFAGGTPTPTGCDGVHTPCVYSHVFCPSTELLSCPSNNVGELNGNMAGLLATEQGITTPFKVHSDSAPTVYITGNPARDATVARDFERAVGRLTAPNYYTEDSSEHITAAMADPVEEKLLHMVTADQARTPTFTWFADPAYFLFAGASNCNPQCVQEQPGFAWNHGDIQPEIVTTWLGMVGPGVLNLGVDGSPWSDHTDVRPTLLALTGLRDDYQSQGRVLVEALNPTALSPSLRLYRGTIVQLGAVYKQLNAAVGLFGRDTLRISTAALESGTSSDDSTYTTLENKLIGYGNQRDALAGQMQSMLTGAEFGGQPINVQKAQSLIAQGKALLNSVSAEAASVES